MINNSLLKLLGELDDPRIDRNKKHLLVDVLTIAICGVVSGAEGWEHIEMFARIKEDWLRSFLELPNGIPSHDTIARVFRAIDPDQFQEVFTKWVGSIELKKEGKVVAIDGKSLRRSFDNSMGCGPLHMVSAWAVDAGLALGQVKTNKKSNEITAIPELLELLDLNGAIVTIDAMGCQKQIAQKIVNKKADYVLALKKNHPDLHNEVESLFSIGEKRHFKEMTHDNFTTIEKGHGRIETRTCTTLSAQDWFPDMKEWAGLQSLVRIESTRETNGCEQRQVRYYLSSCPPDAHSLLKAVRSHWGIENSLHWVLDMNFREDESRIRKGGAAENLATIRKIVLNLIKLNKPNDLSFKKAKLAATWDTDFALKTLLKN